MKAKCMRKKDYEPEEGWNCRCSSLSCFISDAADSKYENYRYE